MELATQSSWYQHLRDKLASKFRVHESALEKGLYLYEFNGRLTFVTVTHVDVFVLRV